MKLINIGFGNMVSAERLVAIVSPDSAPIRRIISETKENGTLIDATCGRRTRAVLFLTAGMLFFQHLCLRQLHSVLRRHLNLNKITHFALFYSFVYTKYMTVVNQHNLYNFI